ncbi:DUF4158 domain-containing protein [Candidatus Uabimicrobium sp. HlEnr_7]|uniref:DUF4158 domain-containing protein n=1 Tax=Candidatus Uabimicrobium helgolandensis TaxID=3095367 RepID=UPI0035585B08
MTAPRAPRYQITEKYGYFIFIKDVPESIILHISDHFELEIPKNLTCYDNTGSRPRYMSLIRNFLNIHAYNEETKNIIFLTMKNAAKTKDEISDIINVAVEELVKQKHELPAFSTLLRTTNSTRSIVNKEYYTVISSSIGSEDKEK